MSRIGLAFRSFFGLLFGGRLPADATRYLPEAAPAAKAELPAKIETQASAAAPKPRPKKSADELAHSRSEGALLLLGLFQREGRLVDFLREGLDSHDDADIGAAVRDIHRGCQKVLREHFDIEAVMPGAEDDAVTVPKGFDPGEVKLIGDAKGEPPFRGVLRHHGWRATKIKLPSLAEGVDRHVLAPAEVEVGR